MKKEVCIMFDQPVAARISAFIEAANGVDPYSRQYLPAQNLFLRDVMGVTDPEVLDNPYKPNPLLRDAFITMASRTIDQVTGTQMQVAESLEEMLGRIPPKHSGMKWVLDKVALRCGAREPAFGFTK